ncbi:MAG TPA: 50S ribosomal protein L18 [Candidatus Sulfotelmatobacter sp.]|nr:50S ribosomal protein L18 [Candidatus Sulfotelmatobacter sp.]
MKFKRKGKKVFGTAERPRLSVFRGTKNITAQLINDETGDAILAAGTVGKAFKGNGGNVAAAQAIGKMIAEKAIAKGIKKVVFDRGKYVYHGRIKALADAARQGGLQF